MENKTDHVVIIGAGLAGSEAAYQLAKRGIHVKLYEMKPNKMTPAHKAPYYAELVCSNSLGSNNIDNASGLMKEELRLLDSLIIRIADETKVLAGQALAVDRDGFSQRITEILQNTANIEIINEEIKKIPSDVPVLISSGPLTTDDLAGEISKLTNNKYLYFYDAAAPIVTKESIDLGSAYFQSRYDKGDGEYINCPMTEEDYNEFYNALITAERVPLKIFEKEKLFDACMPIERIAMTGSKSMLFGPLKPKGLTNPKTGKRDHAVVQLRQDDKSGTLYNMVGFQTNLKWGEQKRVFSMIPALRNAEFIRYGVMHRNTFIESPKLLNIDLSLRNNENIYFAGQITGSEGYVCAIATGAYAAINIANKINSKERFILDDKSAIGAMIKYVTEDKEKFQPMGPNFGIMKHTGHRTRDKKERYKSMADAALIYVKEKIAEIGLI